MKVIFYKNKSPFNKVFKNLEKLAEYDGNIVDEFDEKNPTLRFNASYIKGNYAQIDGKYYYILDVTSPANGIYIARFSLDVLYTYRDYIMATTAVIERSTSGDDMINDNQYKILGVEKSRKYMTTDEGFGDTENEGTYILATSSEGQGDIV